jgi:hypothetical protein
MSKMECYKVVKVHVSFTTIRKFNPWIEYSALGWLEITKNQELREKNLVRAKI